MAFSPQLPSFTFVPRGSSPTSGHSQVKELPTDTDVKPSTPLPSKTFTCKDPEVKHMFPSSLLTLAKEYQSDDADYTIRSSDVIDFKVHSYRLQAASPYFRALMKEDKPATSLCLAISGFHGALVVKNLLDIIYTSEPTGCQNIELAFQVITLATEWECEAVLKILKEDLAIQALINSTQGPSNDHLRLAYKLGDYRLMALIAQRDRVLGPMFVLSKGPKVDGTGVHRLYDRPAAGLVGNSAGIESPFFEIGGFSYDEFLRLPPTVVWALARSSYLVRVDHGEVDVNAMAQLFEKLLRSAYPTPPPRKQAAPTQGVIVPTALIPSKAPATPPTSAKEDKRQRTSSPPNDV